MSQKIEFVEDHFIIALNTARELYPENMPEPTPEHMEKIIAKIQFIESSGYYGTPTEQALHVWYEIVKSHILSNGNKRMGLLCFVTFCILRKIKISFQKKGKSFLEYSLYIAEQSSSQSATNKDTVINYLKKEIKLTQLK